ncbi:hypothetical protein C7R41_13260, partial [Staphylococcus aureus]
STSMSTLGFIDINKAPFKVFIFSMSTLKGAFQGLTTILIIKGMFYSYFFNLFLGMLLIMKKNFIYQIMINRCCLR